MMLKRGILIATSLWFSNIALAQDNWQIYKPEDNTFSISLPCKAETGTKSILTDVGTLETITVMCQPEAYHPNRLYLINYVDYPKGSFHSDSIDIINSLFEISIAQHIRDLGGELIYEADQSLGNIPGRIYRASYNKGQTFVKSAIYLAGDRFYSIQVYGLLAKSLNDEMDFFLNSFKILH